MDLSATSTSRLPGHGAAVGGSIGPFRLVTWTFQYHHKNKQSQRARAGRQLLHVSPWTLDVCFPKALSGSKGVIWVYCLGTSCTTHTVLHISCLSSAHRPEVPAASQLYQQPHEDPAAHPTDAGNWNARILAPHNQMGFGRGSTMNPFPAQRPPAKVQLHELSPSTHFPSPQGGILAVEDERGAGPALFRSQPKAAPRQLLCSQAAALQPAPKGLRWEEVAGCSWIIPLLSQVGKASHGGASQPPAAPSWPRLLRSLPVGAEICL